MEAEFEEWAARQYNLKSVAEKAQMKKGTLRASHWWRCALPG